LYAAALARRIDAHITPTARAPEKTELIKEYGAEEVIADTATSISAQV